MDQNFSNLTKQQQLDYQRHGFLVIENFISSQICASLIHHANSLIDQFNPEHTKSIFAAKEGDRHQLRNKYFLESGHQIHFFFEENAFDAAGNLKYSKAKSINKIGHALHDLDPVFNRFSRMSCIAKLVKNLSVQDPLLLQSMYICKQPHIGGEVNCHQDKTYLYTEGEPVIGLWFALEDATLENGCLWAIPGAHKMPLKKRLRRDQHNSLQHEVFDENPWALEKMVPLEVPRGSLIVLHGHLPHMSKENTSARSRHAYSLHLISKKAQYPDDNWLSRPAAMPLMGF